MVVESQPVAIRRATAGDAESVYDLVVRTIHAVYPSCYEPALVEGFVDYHNPDAIASDISQGRVYVLETGGGIVATGSVNDEFITRVYVEPSLRGKGYGSAIMDKLEALMSQERDVAAVEASAAAELFYLKRGYHVARTEKVKVEAKDDLPEATLVYKVMEKDLGT